MIARIGYFDSPTPEQAQAAADNLTRRFKAALASQPGAVAAFWLKHEDGRVMAVSVWDSREAMEDGGRRANSVPLAAGQHAENIPSPDRVELVEVIDHFIA